MLHREVRLRVWFIVITLTITLFSFVLGPVAEAVEFGNIGGEPANPDSSNPRTKSIFIANIDRLETKNDAVNVVNYTNEAKTLLVYATDGIESSGGAFGCAQKVDDKNAVGSWVTMSKEEVFLEPGQTEVVPFSVTPPATAEVGENNGCIVIQEKDPEEQSIDNENSSIAISFRTAIRLAVTIPGEVKKELKILGYASERLEGRKYILKPRVRNVGNVSLDTKLNTYTSGIFGWPSENYSQESPILRGVTSDWNIPFEKTFWGGWYKSYFTVDYDKNPNNRIGQEENPQIATLTSQTIYFFIMPHPLAALIELVLISALSYLAYFIYSRFFVIGGKKRKWITIVITQQVDIVTVAKAHHIGWKKLARKNRIKAPYILFEGQKIRVPDNRAQRNSKNYRRIYLPFTNPSVPVASWKVITITALTDIESLAKQYGIPWKQLAKHNKLKPPYILHQGQSISVPNTEVHKSIDAVSMSTRTAPEWKKIRIMHNQDIESLAKQYGIPWKQLAKHNKLKPPYIVKVGDDIEVPTSGYKGKTAPPIVNLLTRIPFFARRKYSREWDEITIGSQVDNFVNSYNDLESLGRAYGVSWKLLAKINKIKAPYILKNGDKIKVPPKKQRPM